MAQQPRLRRSYLVLAGMVVSLAIGVYLERMRIYGFAAPGSNSYEFFDTLVDIRSQIRNNYVENVDDKKLLEGAINGMLSELDPYSNYFSEEDLQAFEKGMSGKFTGIGAELAQDPPQTGPIIVISPIEDSPALKAGVMAGDRIVKVNGESIEGMSLPDVVKKVQGLPGTEVVLTVVHEGEKTPVDLTIKRAVITVHSVKGARHINGNGEWDYLIDPEHRIAYVRITSFMETTAEDLDKALLPLINSKDGLRGIVLDLRFNPGGLLNAGVEVADRFLESGAIVSTRGRDGRNVDQREAKADGTYPRIPLVVLVNEYSASASEIVAGALKDHDRAVLVGTRTFGKGSVQNLITLGGGKSAVKLTTAYYYLPSGKNITKKKDSKTWGVEPDAAFLVPMTEEENRAMLRARRDSEIIRPGTRPATMPVAGGGSTQPATAPATAPGMAEGTDRQLQRALEMLIAYQAFHGEKPLNEVTTTRPGASASVPTTAPATEPATAPAPVDPPATVPTPPDARVTPPSEVELPH